MGNQPVAPSTTSNSQLNRTGTQSEINKSTMNVFKGYGSKGSESQHPQSLSRSITVLEQQKPKSKYNISIQNLKDTFKTYSIDNSYLNKDRFNDSIESLFRFPQLPEMHYTYLSDKIYELLDDSGDGKIQEEEFIQGMKNVFSSRDFRTKRMLMITLMAMMNLPDKTRNYIEPNEIKEYFFKSWIQGYRHLGWQIRKDKNDFQSRKLPLANSKQLEIWALRYEAQIKMAIETDLRENGIDPNMNIEFEQFKKWVYLDHTLYISYGHKNVMIATTLTKLDEVGFDDSQGQGVNPLSASLMSNNQNSQPNYYPSF